MKMHMIKRHSKTISFVAKCVFTADEIMEKSGKTVWGDRYEEKI